MSTADRLAALLGRHRVDEDDDRLPVGLTLLVAAIAALLLAPLAWLFLQAASVGTDRAWRLLTGPTTREVLVNSLALVAAVTAGSIVVGVPPAVLTVQTDLPFRRFWTVAAALPLVIPSYIGAFTFVSAFGPRGELADALAPLGVETLPTIYGFHGAALVLTLFTYPYVFLTTRASLQSFDPRLVEAARTLNHSKWAAFRRVTLPQILPGIAAGSLLVALYTLSDFGTPAIMRFDVFTRVIYVEQNAFGRDYAALLSLQLLAVTAVILALESRVGSSGRSAYVSRGVGRAGRMALGRWKYVALVPAVAVTTLSLVVPLAVLVFWLFARGPGYQPGGFGFEAAFAWNSVSVAALAALAAVVLAVPVAYLSARYRSRLTTVLDRATYVGYAVPGIVLGLALVYVGTGYAPGLYQTIPLLVFAYVVRFVPQAVGSIRSSVLQVDPTLTEAARTLGKTPAESFRRVTLPLIVPGVAAGAALVFLTTMKELPATLLLAPTGFDTIVTYIWRVQEAAYYGQAAVPALLLVAISGLSMALLLARRETNGG